MVFESGVAPGGLFEKLGQRRKGEKTIVVFSPFLLVCPFLDVTSQCCDVVITAHQKMCRIVAGRVRSP